MLAGNDAVALPNLDLTLWWNREAGCGASFEGYHRPAVPKPVAKALVSSKIAGIHGAFGFLALLLEHFLLLARILEHFVQLTAFVVENLIELCKPLFRFLDARFFFSPRVGYFFHPGIGIYDSLSLGFDLLSERVVFPVVSDLELLLFVAFDQVFGFLDVSFGLAVGKLIVDLFLFELFNPGFETCLFVFEVADLVW